MGTSTKVYIWQSSIARLGRRICYKVVPLKLTVPPAAIAGPSYLATVYSLFVHI